MSNNDNYVSPYGFGPVTDAVLDCIVERRDMTVGQMEDVLGEARESLTGLDIDSHIEQEWWETHMGPAVDALEDMLSPYLPEVDNANG